MHPLKTDVWSMTVASNDKAENILGIDEFSAQFA